MEVTVRFYASLKDITETPQIKVHTQTGTVGDVFSILISKYGSKFRDEILNADGSIKKNITVLINGLNVDRIAPLQSQVKEGDSLYLFPPILAG